MGDQSPSHRARVKVQFWVPAEAAGEIERWRASAKAKGVELGPWLRGLANLMVHIESEAAKLPQPDLSKRRWRALRQ